MAQPPFTKSKYVSELDLQRDARKHYQKQAEKYEEALIAVLNAQAATPVLTYQLMEKIARKALGT